MKNKPDIAMVLMGLLVAAVCAVMIAWRRCLRKCTKMMLNGNKRKQ